MKNILSVCRALSDRNRLRLVAALADHDELCACQLTEMLAVSGATASRHLAVLIDAGLVDSRKAGRWVYYRLRVNDTDNTAAGNTAQGEFAPVVAWLRAELAGSEEVAGDKERLRAITECSPEEFCRQHRGRGTAKTRKTA